MKTIAGLDRLNVIKRDGIGGRAGPGDQLGAGGAGAADLVVNNNNNNNYIEGAADLPVGVARCGAGLLPDGGQAGGTDQGSSGLESSQSAPPLE